MREIYSGNISLYGFPMEHLILHPGDVVFFRGELGSGKTTCIGACIRKLLREPGIHIPSPTYTYYHRYPRDIVHFDLYRVRSYDDFIRIGGEEILDRPEGIAFIEWPEVLTGTYSPTYDIQLGHTSDSQIRHICIHHISENTHSCIDKHTSCDTF